MEFKDEFFLLASILNVVLAIPLKNILGIYRLEAITPIPNNNNKYLLGVTNAKGNIVPVLDLTMEEKFSDPHFLVVIEKDQEKKSAIFKKIEGVVQLFENELAARKLMDAPIPLFEIIKNGKRIIITDLQDAFFQEKVLDILKSKFA